MGQDGAPKLLTLKRINDFYALEFPGVLHIFGEEDSATCLLCSAKDQSIPEREAVKAMKVNRAEYVSDIDPGDIELSQ